MTSGSSHLVYSSQSLRIWAKNLAVPETVPQPFSASYCLYFSGCARSSFNPFWIACIMSTQYPLFSSLSHGSPVESSMILRTFQVMLASQLPTVTNLSVSATLTLKEMSYRDRRSGTSHQKCRHRSFPICHLRPCGCASQLRTY